MAVDRSRRHGAPALAGPEVASQTRGGATPSTTSTNHPSIREEPVMGWTNPQTGSEIEIEDDGDYTVTFSMSLPQQPADDEG